MDTADFSETLHVHGEISTVLGGSAPLTFSVTYPKYRPGPLRAHGILTDREHHPLEIGFPGVPGEIKVWGQLASGEILRLDQAKIESARFRESDFSLSCRGFTYGMESSLEFVEGKYCIEVALPHTRVADTDIPEMKSYLGKIETKRTAGDGIKWHSLSGEALLADFYHFEHLLGQADEVTRVKETAIQFKGMITDTIDPPKLLNQVDQEIDDPLRLLSFIGRKILRWFEIRASFEPADTDKYRRCTFLKRRYFRSGDTEAGDPLLLHGQLLHGKFQHLVESLRASSIGDWLRRAMAYSSASHRDGSLESQLSAAYLALEALSLGFARNKGREKVLAKVESQRFLSRIKLSVDDFCRESHLDEDINEQLVANAATLGRTSFKRRIKALIEETKIPTEDLWPPGMGLSKGLQRMIERRNKFIHEAKIEFPPSPLAKDMQRVQAIVERTILTLLGWDPSQLSPSLSGYNWLREDD